MPGVEGDVPDLPLCMSLRARFPVVLRGERAPRIERVDRLENEWRREGMRLTAGGLCEGAATLAAMLALRVDSTPIEPNADPYEDGPAPGDMRPGDGHAALSYPNSVGVN